MANKKGNNYIIDEKNGIAKIELKRRGKDSLWTIIDIEDLEKVLNFPYTWFSKYYADATKVLRRICRKKLKQHDRSKILKHRRGHIKMLSEKTIEILENNDMKIYDRCEQDGEFIREIEFYSPEGEDVCECIFYDGTDESFIKAFRSNAENFDANEHAEMWIRNRGQVGGVPESAKDLITDAEWIKDTLLSVADELEADENTENLSCMNRRQFYDYIIENFDISGEAGRLINNILHYVESQGMTENEQYLTLCELLDGTIGLSDAELKKVCL